MRILVQRCKHASVRVNGELVGKIEHGLMLLVGVAEDDTTEDVRYLADKIVNLRIFEDDQGKMNRSLLEFGGAILSVSQFTLHADCRKGRRPSFTGAARPEQAILWYETFNDCLRDYGLIVQTGQFGAMMDVDLCNWGPVTIWLDSRTMRNG